MRTILLTLPALLLATACASQPTFDSKPYHAAASERPAIDTGPSKKHVVRPFVGGTTERGGGGLTLGGQYEYGITRDWAQVRSRTSRSAVTPRSCLVAPATGTSSNG